MTLSEMYNEVARKADTKGTQINVAEVKRVLATFFDLLEDQKPDVAFELINKGLKASGKRRR